MGSMIRDAGINVSAQKVEHYEITAYGSLAQLAITMGQDGAAELLPETLIRRRNTNKSKFLSDC